MLPATFHFLRPEWLLALFPLGLLLMAAWRRRNGQSAWQKIVDRHLLQHLMLTGGGKARRWPLALLALGWLAATLAMAGPAWQQLPQPTHKIHAPTVVALNLSQSMNARDESPSRLARAKHKIFDLMLQNKGGQTGLVIFTDSAFAAVPLTDDSKVIEELLPLIDTSLMPDRGARVDQAILEATALLQQSGAPQGQILLLTDSMTGNPDETVQAARIAEDQGYSLGIITLGSAEGAPIFDHRGRPLLDDQGEAIISLPHHAALSALAQTSGATLAQITPDDQDLRRVLSLIQDNSLPTKGDETGMEADSWMDMGVWLLLILLALAPLAFRRGWLAAFIVTAGLGTGSLGQPATAAAKTTEFSAFWSDLWFTKDQQAAKALGTGDSSRAAKTFQDPDWRAAAHYRAGDYAQAAREFEQLEGPRNLHNLGNARAKAGDLEGALQAYDEALALNAEHEDARFNRDLVQSLLDQEKQETTDKAHQDQRPDESQPQKNETQQSSQEKERSTGPDPKSDSENSQGNGSEKNQETAQGGQQQRPHSSPPGQNEPSDNSDPSQSSARAQQQVTGGDAGSPRENEQAAQEESTQNTTEIQQPSPQEQRAHGAASSGSPPQGKTPEPDDLDKAREFLAHSLDNLLGQLNTKPEPTADETASQSPIPSTADTELSEDGQAREQMLRLVPDDPAGLLRARIYRHYAKQQAQQKQ